MKKRLFIGAGLQLLCMSAAQAVMIARWTFDDTLTNSVSSSYGAVSFGSGTPQYSTDAIYGKSLLFSNPKGNLAATNKLRIMGGGDWAGSASWTFSAWIKPTALVTTQDVFGAGSTSNINYATYCDLRGTTNGSVNFNTYYNDDGPTTIQNAGTVAWGGTTNDWYRLTIVFNADTHTVTEYRDSSDAAGGLTMLKTSTANYGTPVTLTNFILGASSAGLYGFQGYMDDVSIYNTALTQPEVDVIPEPATLGLLGLAGGLVLIMRRAQRFCLK